MKIELDLVNAPFAMVAKNPDGNTVSIDASPEIGGQGKGARPTELLLMGVAGCSGIDILSILAKMKAVVDSFHVDVVGDKEEVGTVKLFTKISIHYKFTGDLEADKVKRAIDLSLEKYCSVSKTLEKTAKISYTFEINGEKH
ncbi:OsmC family protein [Leptospira sp. GIMC2001]|uniref:OsmC family protein n=1 Tax=Leptospira sp. GIMC2001 TaxID=1513297 RepID=UPI00234B2EC8|nr:OsmC family protein [Leptospira sp. GIMC2001]WCL47701.1 OsmC family protein [Leptospira sp. GIMC2001]